ncbi:MAG TPA: hypothetical protein VMT37_07015 [Solirubrobacterales bacterium]|nr:hypothetical protein [Solirubrobacterales bacterium]
MLSGPKPKLLISMLVLAGILVLPAAAHAMLAYVKYGRYPLSPYVFTATNAGKEEIRVGRGYDPQVSPDGAAVAYINEEPSSGRHRLKVVSVRGGASDQLFDAARISFVTWSPDSETIAAVRAPRHGPQALVLVSTVFGGERVVARGHFTGVSFSPDGTQLAFSRVVNRGDRRPGNDIFRISVGAPHSVQRLTYDHRSKRPVWGVSDQIAFVKEMGSKHHEQLYGMTGDGGSVYRMVPRRSYAKPREIVPVAWSANGRLLLANVYPNAGSRSGVALMVEPGTHAQWPAQRPKAGFVGVSFSCDGHRVLGSSGGFHSLSNHRVGTVASNGSWAAMSVLTRFAFEPSWGTCGG